MHSSGRPESSAATCQQAHARQLRPWPRHQNPACRRLTATARLGPQ